LGHGPLVILRGGKATETDLCSPEGAKAEPVTPMHNALPHYSLQDMVGNLRVVSSDHLLLREGALLWPLPWSLSDLVMCGSGGTLPCLLKSPLFCLPMPLFAAEERVSK